MSAADPEPPRLAPRLLERLPADIARPAYDRAAQRTGIVHLGIGAFHRAHQAAFTDDAMALGDRDWGIAGVSLRSPSVRAQLAPQDGLYSLVERGSDEERVRVIGAVRASLVAGEDQPAILEALAAPDTHILSFTITEKGYHRAPGGDLDFDAEAIRADLTQGGVPRSIYGLLRAGLERRRAAGRPGLTLLSCDNLAGNGAVLRDMLGAFLDAADPGLASWFAAECAVPCSMVDRIVPATTPDDLDALARRFGVRDEAAVITEPFRQWVIEDRFAGPRPRWEAVGAEIVGDVHGYELAKLRMLNGAHSALAYLGLRSGHAFVHQAIADPSIRRTVEQLIHIEAASTLPPTPGFDPRAYAGRLLDRFANRRLPHSLAQIAMDGSQKIPQRWLATLSERSARGDASPALSEALAAWIHHVRGDRHDVVDPLAGKLAGLWRAAGSGEIVPALFGPGGLFAESWRAGPNEIAALADRVRSQDVSRD